MAENSFVDLKINSPASGSVYFASDVIATIAGLSLTEIEGIANIIKYGGLRNDKSGKKNTLNIKNLTKGIRVDVKDNLVSVSITSVIEYGYSVPEVCRAIQENVKKTIETMTGMSVKSVDVHVTGLNFEKENAAVPETDYHSYLTQAEAKAIAEGQTGKEQEG